MPGAVHGRALTLSDLVVTTALEGCGHDFSHLHGGGMV